MKNENKTGKKYNSCILTIIIAGFMILTACSTDEPSASDSVYSGSGSFNFTGDYNMVFQGNVSQTRIEELSSAQSLPLSFIDNQGREFFIGLRGNPDLGARTYKTEDLLSEAFAGITLDQEIYDSGAKGGTGTVTLSRLNGKEIIGRVELRLARALNTADTVLVKGNFDLRAD